MKSNLPEPDPAPRNPLAEAITKTDGLYLVTAPGSGFAKFSAALGVDPVAFVWVGQGQIHNIIIGPVIAPEDIPAKIVFKGPLSLP